MKGTHGQFHSSGLADRRNGAALEPGRHLNLPNSRSAKAQVYSAGDLLK
jgi:hypothetical protein